MFPFLKVHCRNFDGKDVPIPSLKNAGEKEAAPLLQPRNPFPSGFVQPFHLKAAQGPPSYEARRLLWLDHSSRGREKDHDQGSAWPSQPSIPGCQINRSSVARSSVDSLSHSLSKRRWLFPVSVPDPGICSLFSGQISGQVLLRTLQMQRSL